MYVFMYLKCIYVLKCICVYVFMSLICMYKFMYLKKYIMKFKSAQFSSNNWSSGVTFGAATYMYRVQYLNLILYILYLSRLDDAVPKVSSRERYLYLLSKKSSIIYKTNFIPCVTCPVQISLQE